MAFGLSFPNDERPKDLPELTNKEITEHITKVFDAAAHKMASAFNSFNLSGE